jgi:glycosyltransferase involved in cell wall biosynthesis
LGGADTRVVDLLRLLHRDYKITVVPNFNDQLKQEKWTNLLDSLGIRYMPWEEMPSKQAGVAIAFCNFWLFDNDNAERLRRAKDIGLRFIWSNDMMYHTDSELKGVAKGLVDTVIYTSEFHKSALSKEFVAAYKVREEIVPNFVDGSVFLARLAGARKNFTIGKLSRACTSKYSDGFPMFYESLDRDCHFKVMGWDDALARKYAWHNFGSRWKFHKPDEMSSIEFLKELDLYVYDCHHTFVENQSRSIVEASLMGIPIIVPRKWNFPNMVVHGRTGFLWNDYEECKHYYSVLRNDPDLLREFSENSPGAMSFFTDKTKHLEYWKALIDG